MSRLSVFYILFFISSCSINEEWSLMSCIVTNNVPYWLFFIQQQDPDYLLFISATELILSCKQWSRQDVFLGIFSRRRDSPAVRGVSVAALIRWDFWKYFSFNDELLNLFWRSCQLMITEPGRRRQQWSWGSPSLELRAWPRYQCRHCWEGR